FATIAIVGFANAVNITDGLDGLASKTSIVSLSVFSILIFLCSNTLLSHTYGLQNIPAVKELLVFCFALGGSLLGFLFFNAKPASIFMGDVGSLFLGGVFGLLSVILKTEILFIIFGFLFVAELGSSFFQTTYFKITRKLTGQGKRIFKMAPLHHHFEQLGIPETKVSERFFITSIIFAFVAILSLFIRV
ncbi:MAG: phospho-N-acetylmuramoyl-pentapeptide-transferase, partial [Rickettsiales bacterium]|nr:phospho-N-acetylmuramoyl-pentapeptide-transferase [Rickettsiales bacterium]